MPFSSLVLSDRAFNQLHSVLKCFLLIKKLTQLVYFIYIDQCYHPNLRSQKYSLSRNWEGYSLRATT